MINIAVNDKDSKVLGFAFYLFGRQEYVYDYDNYETEFEMANHLISSKSDILGINIERFVRICSEGLPAKTILIEESIEKLRKATKWRVKNKDKYKEFLNLVLRGRSLMKDLVHAQVEHDKKVKAIMMYKIIMNFVEDEVKDDKPLV